MTRECLVFRMTYGTVGLQAGTGLRFQWEAQERLLRFIIIMCGCANYLMGRWLLR